MRASVAEELADEGPHQRGVSLRSKLLALTWVDAKQALNDLREISSQIGAAVLMESDGAVLGSTLADGSRAEALAAATRELLAAADRTRRGVAPDALTQLEVATLEGSVFVVRDGKRVLAATTSPEPTVGLVFYDLKSCLRNAQSEPPKPKPRRASKPKSKPPKETGDAGP